MVDDDFPSRCFYPAFVFKLTQLAANNFSSCADLFGQFFMGGINYLIICTKLKKMAGKADIEPFHSELADELYQAADAPG
ncbi:hypothetical protein A9Q88_01200 [Gammaproteobacteria bacterium 50_400_T64]|nr:hypothetical protein A9Q88_01200 [Gammaproteobacteria bacterium 50_400_T64]